MKYCFPILTCLLAVGSSGGQEGPEPTGAELIRAAAEEVARQPGIESRIRHRVEVAGQQLIGVGTYLQARNRQETLVRMELKVQVAEQLSSTQQVCDGRFLWIRQEFAAEHRLSRVDLRRVRESLRDASAAGASANGASGNGGTPDSHLTAAAVLPHNGWAACGLPKILQGLALNLHFASPRAVKVGDLGMWEVHGYWRPEALAKISGSEEGSRSLDWSKLPPHLPDSVVLWLGQEGPIPLFPYRIEYRRHTLPVESGYQRSGEKKGRSLLVVEFFEVRRRGDLDPRYFSFQVGDQAVEDHTDAFVRTLRGS